MAGFFYRPTAHEHDNVTCFLCKKSLDGWVSQDEPAIEHLIHSPECAWALHACISLRSEDPNRAEEDPMTERMVAARTDTFQNSWPHEHKKGWKCKTQKVRTLVMREDGSADTIPRWSRQGGAMIRAQRTTTE